MSRLLQTALLSAALLACDREAAAPKAAPPPSAKMPESAAPAQSAASAAPASADAPDASTKHAPKQLSQAPLQKRGCTKLDDVTLPVTAYRLLIPTQDSALQALVLRDDQITLEWWSGELGGPAVLRASHKLTARVTKLSLLRRAAASYTVAAVDEQGGLWGLHYSAGKWADVKQLARGADRRFAPALYEDGAISLLAYTSSVDKAMHTFVVRSLAGQGVDVTPAGHGAAAPTFVSGVDQPVLVFVDAHEGISPLLEVGFDENLKPQPALVRTPISQPYAPPLLRAVAIDQGEVEVAFTAVGKLAASAIGRVPLRRAASAVALHPSRGYGELDFDVALSGKAAIFALEVPVDEKPNAEHVLELKWLDQSGDGATLELVRGAALRPSIAATPLPGELLVAYVTGTTPHLTRLRCDSGG
ncbi:MAG TPA: hypothetical protein VFZ61_20200 [Polyangiales bacterium]